MVKNYLSRKTGTRHSYKFYKKRRNDPQWIEDFIYVRSIRRRNAIIGWLIVAIILCVGTIITIQGGVQNSKKIENKTERVAVKKPNKKVKNNESHNEQNNSSTQNTEETLIPSKMQGTWYSYDEVNNVVVKFVITKNTMNGQKIHTVAEMTPEEKEFYTKNDDYLVKDPQVSAHKDWLWKTGEPVKDGKTLIQLNASGQMNYNGDRYGVYTKDINGESTSVLTTFVGMDGFPIYAYRTEELASQMKNEDVMN